jgi:hypothetical protein
LPASVERDQQRQKSTNGNGGRRMYKSFITLAAAAAIASFGSLLPAQAGGGATSAPSKYSHTANVDQQSRPTRVHSANVTITEFSSSSARHGGSKR